MTESLRYLEAGWHLEEDVQNAFELPDVIAALVYRSDGELVISRTEGTMELAPVLLWLKKAVHTSAKDIFRSRLEKTVVEVFGHNVLMYPINRFGLLVVVAKKRANIGLLMIEVRRKATTIAEGAFSNGN